MRIYTGVGSRVAPDDILNLTVRFAQYLADIGWGPRSGAAPGMDDAFYSGAVLSNNYPNIPCEIYLPWRGFNGLHNPIDPNFIMAPELGNYQQAIEIVSKVHPIWEKLKRGPRALHTRNVYQVLGLDLATLSKALVCYAEPIKDGIKVKGGTATAVALARLYNVPVHNFYYDEVCRKAEDLIAQYNLKKAA